MPQFKYKARDKFGRLVAGLTSATDDKEAARKLMEMGYAVLSMQLTPESRARKLLLRFRKVKLEELNTFTRQLYSLQKAGLTLLGSLEAISEQIENKYFKSVVDELARDIRGGKTFSQALEKHVDVFDPIYVNMIRAAESGGLMVETLDRLGLIIEQDIDTASRIQSSTRYPLIAFVVLCAGFLILVTFVIPKFANIYSQFKATLPLPTRVLIGINFVIRKFWYIFVVLGVSVFMMLRAFFNTERGKALRDSVFLKVPVFGKLVGMLIMSRFARITAVLIKSGVPILETLELSARTCGNVVIARAIRLIRQSVNEGKGMSEPMKVTHLFPAAIVQMVSVGEQSGRLEELLMNVADYYDREASYMIKNLTTYIEPVLVLVLGGMVLFMALGIFLPMWNLIKVFNPS